MKMLYFRKILIMYNIIIVFLMNITTNVNKKDMITHLILILKCLKNIINQILKSFKSIIRFINQTIKNNT